MAATTSCGVILDEVTGGHRGQAAQSSALLEVAGYEAKNLRHSKRTATQHGDEAPQSAAFQLAVKEAKEYLAQVKADERRLEDRLREKEERKKQRQQTQRKAEETQQGVEAPQSAAFQRAVKEAKEYLAQVKKTNKRRLEDGPREKAERKKQRQQTHRKAEEILRNHTKEETERRKRVFSRTSYMPPKTFLGPVRGR